MESAAGNQDFDVPSTLTGVAARVPWIWLMSSIPHTVRASSTVPFSFSLGINQCERRPRHYMQSTRVPGLLQHRFNVDQEEAILIEINQCQGQAQAQRVVSESGYSERVAEKVAGVAQGQDLWHWPVAASKNGTIP